MKACIAPNGSCLPTNHQAFFRELLRAFKDAEYKQSKLEPALPGLVSQLSALCSTEELLSAWCEEVGINDAFARDMRSLALELSDQELSTGGRA